MVHLAVGGEKAPETALTAANQTPPLVFIVREPANPEWNPVNHLGLMESGGMGRFGYALASPRARNWP
jgi:hypothetical protein